jgi:phenylalanyl-tRNA synthetase alpha chain
LLTDHPLNIIKNKIEKYCNEYAMENRQSKFAIYDKEPPVADTKNCFDDLLVPPDHCSRSRSDTYYLTDKLVC